MDYWYLQKVVIQEFRFLYILIMDLVGIMLFRPFSMIRYEMKCGFLCPTRDYLNMIRKLNHLNWLVVLSARALVYRLMIPVIYGWRMEKGFFIMILKPIHTQKIECPRGTGSRICIVINKIFYGSL